MCEAGEFVYNNELALACIKCCCANVDKKINEKKLWMYLSTFYWKNEYSWVFISGSYDVEDVGDYDYYIF